MSQSSGSSVLGKRDESPIDMDISQDSDADLRGTRATKRSKLGHSDGSDTSEREGPSKMVSPVTPRAPRQQGTSDESQAQDSLPSPPLSVEIPFMPPRPAARHSEGRDGKTGGQWTRYSCISTTVLQTILVLR